MRNKRSGVETRHATSLLSAFPDRFVSNGSIRITPGYTVAGDAAHARPCDGTAGSNPGRHLLFYAVIIHLLPATVCKIYRRQIQQDGGYKYNQNPKVDVHSLRSILGCKMEQHPKISKVIYPGLKSHPQYDLFRLQTTGSGGVLSFGIKGAVADAEHFLERLKIFALAESLGGVESLIELPSVMTHASVDREVREKTGITDTLIRMSVGVEDVKDLISDLKQAFE
jgi:hypothetical protein